MPLQIIRQDITCMKVDAIVNFDGYNEPYTIGGMGRSNSRLLVI